MRHMTFLLFDCWPLSLYISIPPQRFCRVSVFGAPIGITPNLPVRIAESLLGKKCYHHFSHDDTPLSLHCSLCAVMKPAPHSSIMISCHHLLVHIYRKDCQCYRGHSCSFSGWHNGNIYRQISLRMCREYLTSFSSGKLYDSWIGSMVLSAVVHLFFPSLPLPLQKALIPIIYEYGDRGFLIGWQVTSTITHACMHAWMPPPSPTWLRLPISIHPSICIYPSIS